LDPDANAWDDVRVQKRMAELGVPVKQPAPATPAQPPTSAAAVAETLKGTPTGGAMDQPMSAPIKQFEPVDLVRPPQEGSIHELRSINSDLLPGIESLRPPREEYSDTLYYKDPITGGIFSIYYAFGMPRIRGTGGMPEDRVAELVKTIETQPTREDLDTDGVMMTKPSNMSSESTHRSDLHRLVELAKG